MGVFFVGGLRGYTPGMKTAISIPDSIFDEAERLARQANQSRSELYSRALQEYLNRHAPERVTAEMDAALDAIGEPSGDAETTAAVRRVLRGVEW